MKKLLIIFMLTTTVICAQPAFSSISSMPGAFSRMGFGARGMGMGNAMSSISEGNLVSYYNPALSVFQKDNSFQTSYSIMSMDRSLNFLSFTRKFDFYSSKDADDPDRKPKSTAGVSVGIINAGVSKIDGRDNQGYKTGDLTTTENQFFLAVANRFSEKFSVGIAFKFYYFRLYDKVHSTGLGIDAGAIYKVNDDINLSLMLSDLNSKYKWDTSPLYGTDGGTTTENKFPLLKKVGISYNLRKYKLQLAAEFESSNGGSNILRGGIEYNIIENLFLRGGIDQFNLSNSDFGKHPSFGFSYFKSFGSLTAGIDYAFVIEQYSPGDRHIIGINLNF